VTAASERELALDIAGQLRETGPVDVAPSSGPSRARTGTQSAGAST
jgi:hypothetical protein